MKMYNSHLLMSKLLCSFNQSFFLITQYKILISKSVIKPNIKPNSIQFATQKLIYLKPIVKSSSILLHTLLYLKHIFNIHFDIILVFTPVKGCEINQCIILGWPRMSRFEPRTSRIQSCTRIRKGKDSNIYKTSVTAFWQEMSDRKPQKQAVRICD